MVDLCLQHMGNQGAEIENYEFKVHIGYQKII